jgi:subtilisin family serine protease
MSANCRLFCGSELQHFFYKTCALFILLLLAVPAFSEIRVFPGEYVVELNTSVTRRSMTYNGTSSTLPGTITQSVGQHSVLMVDSKKSTFITVSKSVPYDSGDTFCAELLLSGKALSCSPNYEYSVVGNSNDPLLAQQWGLTGSAGVHATQAWDVATGAQDVVVAVLDTGIDYTHPDLAPNVWVNTSEIPGNGIDDDDNGYIDDIHGINALTSSGDPFDDNNHGTHVSGTIGAIGNNGTGGSGVAWNVKLMGLKFLAKNGSGSLAGAIAALDYAVMMKSRGVNIKLTNNSWGGGGYSQQLEAAIKRSTDAGILFVAAAGNEGKNIDATASYPASFVNPLILSVAAHDSNTNLASFSNYGTTSVDISAPGVSILSTVPGGGYASFSGTSMASPHVAGVAAVAFQVNPGINAAGVIQRVLESGRDSAAHFSLTRTGRLVDLDRLLRNQYVPINSSPLPISSCTYGIVNIPFSPNRSVEGSPVLIQADELNYTTVPLQFNFPFFNSTYSSITVSPNGLVYMGSSAPSGMDFRNSAKAPMNSIAVLHTDLSSSGGVPLGVRVLQESNSVTVYWHSKHYLNPEAGYVTAWITLNSDGSVVSSMDFSNEQTRQFVSQSVTVGMTSSSAVSESIVISNGGSGITKRSFQYVRTCEGQQDNRGGQAVVSELSLHAFSPRGKSVKQLQAGKLFGVFLSGQGSGSVEAQIAFDGINCPGKTAFTLNNGTGNFSARLRKQHESFRKISVTVGGISKQISVRRKRFSRSRKARKRVRTTNACIKLFFSSIQ